MTSQTPEVKEIEEVVEEIGNLLQTGEYDKAVAYFHHQLQKAREEERERIEAIFKKHVPPHAMDLEDSVWLKRLLNKVFQHD